MKGLKLLIALSAFLVLLICFAACNEDNGGAVSSNNTLPSTDTESSIYTPPSTDTPPSVDTAPSVDTPPSKDTVPSIDTVPSSDTEQGGAEDEKPEDTQKPAYFEAQIKENERVIVSPYTGENEVSDELKGIYYSALTPGGVPVNDGSGKIWLCVKPTKDYKILNVNVEGEYTSVEGLGNDLYCISGVSSDLSVSVGISRITEVKRDIFESYGYGITDDGKMLLTWVENPSEPLRYVEVSYMDGDNYVKEYYDGALGEIQLFQMEENRIYTVNVSAVGYDFKGQEIKINGSYMEAPRSVPFPRVEITTENYIWPSCEFVSSPAGCWGAGITNNEYEQCIFTVYNEENQVVYSSTAGKDKETEFSGAKMKIRGNTSARYASSGRFPYKIKLDKKADLLAPFVDRGEKDGYRDKEWLLLNYGNDGYRISGDAIADAVGTEWSPDYCYVSLYVNGEYRGLYVLSEAVKEGNGEGEEQWRVNVDKDGYVFECDAYWWNEELSFATPLTQNTPMHFTFKYPDADKLTKDSKELIYLQEYLTEFEKALMKNDDSYLDYIDLDSFVKWLLVADILCINDGGGCNLFLYKKDSTDSSKIAMGPNWDFDSYMGNAQGLATIRLKWDTAPFYYQHLIEKDSFQKRYKELFWQVCDNLTPYVENAFSLIDEDAHLSLLEYDNIRFGTSAKALSLRKDKFLNWLSEHMAWMKEQFK